MNMWQGERRVIDRGQCSKPTFTPKAERCSRDHPPSARQAESGYQGSWRYTSYLEFSALPAVPPCARLHTKNVLAEWGLSHISDDAELVTSELATNALLASPSAGVSPAVIRLWLLSDGSQFIVVVWDASRQPPLPVQAPVTAEHGRGLRLVAELSSDWGWYVRPDIGGKCVWAQFRLAELLA
jgi:anti-sigma regulatory factor (Ser/Thr protein kinase)